ncbi:MAG: zinc ABC transporter ATP-binding protein ZnuC [Pseudomonadales bacterium]|nr:zinc ABC transporter ATP-binding protein ZnuC [Pseudomonadales bacterium]MCP5216317.1 zinc ABC transporter ATP-binding protein ZnuC [Pseudomonadales bacterium]
MNVPNSLISLDEVSIKIGGDLIIDKVSLAITAGEIITLIGPNGAGKSTLIRAILGLIKITSGRISKAPDLRIGYMPQRLQMDRTIPLNVQGFLNVWRSAHSIDTLTALQQVSAQHLIARPMQSISGGELQRVLLARALLRNPQLLVLDEPVQGVDLQGQTELYQLIKKIRTQYRCAVLMVSHDLHLVMSSTDQVICMNHHICCSGHPERVSNDPAYRELFGIEAVKSIALYAHHHDHSHDDSGNIVDRSEHPHG